MSLTAFGNSEKAGNNLNSNHQDNKQTFNVKFLVAEIFVSSS